jgi:hypothetical protein
MIEERVADRWPARQIAVSLGTNVLFCGQILALGDQNNWKIWPKVAY